ncbi:hypothetical protein AB0C13_25055 [Streptomyces sp. NPDC049099]|uniref:hypothetical protein n=1 Tax=Streptomyces sp. NPDC049099 TaxID=3155768 RepID=UPI003422373C
MTSTAAAVLTEALQHSMRTRRVSPRVELWRHDLHETRETWFRLVDPDGQDPTPEGIAVGVDHRAVIS